MKKKNKIPEQYIEFKQEFHGHKYTQSHGRKGFRYLPRVKYRIKSQDTKFVMSMCDKIEKSKLRELTSGVDYIVVGRELTNMENVENTWRTEPKKEKTSIKSEKTEKTEIIENISKKNISNEDRKGYVNI